MNKKESLVKNLRKSQMEATAAEKEARRQKKELQIRENSRTIWEKRKNKRVRGLRRAMEVYEDSRCQE